MRALLRNVARGKSNDRACEVVAFTEGNIFSKARTQTVSIVFVNRIFKKNLNLIGFILRNRGLKTQNPRFLTSNLIKNEVITVVFSCLEIANN